MVRVLGGQNMIVAELVDGCALTCALCWNRNRKGSFKNMELKTVEKVLDKFHGKRIDWFNWGEPLHHKDFIKIAEMVRRTHSSISSNFSVKLGDEHFEAFKNFSTVYASISGLTEEVYKIYHVSGDFNLVMVNLLKLGELGHKRVIMRWLVHPYNVDQYKEAQLFCEKLKIGFEPTLLNCEVEELAQGFEHEMLKSPKFKALSAGKACRMLDWQCVDVDGNYVLCCATHNVKIGYSIWDDVSDEALKQARMGMELCTTCCKQGYWRMF